MQGLKTTPQKKSIFKQIFESVLIAPVTLVTIPVMNEEAC